MYMCIINSQHINPFKGRKKIHVTSISFRQKTTKSEKNDVSDIYNTYMQGISR